MGLDFAIGCVNSRDVVECPNLLAGRDVFPARRILRGGRLTSIESAAPVGGP